MISKLEALQFAGIKKILEDREVQNMGELAIRLTKVLRILKGFGSPSPALTKAIMELSRIKDISDELLAIRGLGNGAGEDLFNQAVEIQKRQRISQKARISKKQAKRPKSRKKTSKTGRRKAIQPRKKKSKAKTRPKPKVQKRSSR